MTSTALRCAQCARPRFLNIKHLGSWEERLLNDQKCTCTRMLLGWNWLVVHHKTGGSDTKKLRVPLIIKDITPNTIVLTGTVSVPLPSVVLNWQVGNYKDRALTENSLPAPYSCFGENLQVSITIPVHVTRRRNRL